MSGADANRTNGLTGNNSWGYTSPSMGGATFHASYFNNNTGNASVYTDFGIKVSPEAVEGLEVGYAWGTTEATAATEIDDSTVYIKYAYGPVTVGYQESESDVVSETTDDHDTSAFGITYAVSDELTIGYGEHTFETSGDSTLVDQEATAITASYTMGGMTIAGIMNDVDNISGVATDDKEAYELTLSFAF